MFLFVSEPASPAMHLLIMVQTSPANFEERLVIRKYFGDDCSVSDACDMIFIIGKPSSNNTQVLIKQEQTTFGDILQEDFVDSYNNLTLKSLFSLKYFIDLPRRFNWQKLVF